MEFEGENFISDDEERRNQQTKLQQQHPTQHQDHDDDDDDIEFEIEMEPEAEQECALNLSLGHKNKITSCSLPRSSCVEQDETNYHHNHHHSHHHHHHDHHHNQHETNTQLDNNPRSSSNGSSSSSTSGWSSGPESLNSRSPEQQQHSLQANQLDQDHHQSPPTPQSATSISSPISASQAISLLQNAARQHYYHQYSNTINQLNQQALHKTNQTTNIISHNDNTSNILTPQQQAAVAQLTLTTNQYHHLFQQQQLANSPANSRLLFLHHQNHHSHHELGPVHKADSDDLDRIRNFIEQFKARRGALGLTQKQAAQCFRAYTHDRYAFSDNFVGHFEGFQFRPQTAMTIADSLAEWLEFAENETRQGRQLNFMPGKVKETRKRKYEVIRIRDSAKRILVEAFEKNKSPSTSELEQLSRKTNIPSRNIEIFFKNRRTSRQYHQ